MLKPIPCTCGKEPIVQRQYSTSRGHGHVVRCLSCPRWGPHAKTEVGAIRFWNQMSGPKRPFGWEVDFAIRMGIISVKSATCHYRGCTEQAARRKAMARPQASHVIAVRPVTEEEWVRAFGIGRM